MDLLIWRTNWTKITSAFVQPFILIAYLSSATDEHEIRWKKKTNPLTSFFFVWSGQNLLCRLDSLKCLYMSENILREWRINPIYITHLTILNTTWQPMMKHLAP